MLVAYHFFVSYFPLVTYIDALSLRQQKEVIIEEFQFDNEGDKKSIIVGSSIAGHLVKDQLKDAYLLGIANCNSEEMLAVLKEMPNIENKQIVVEVNGLYAATHDFSSYYFNPVTYYPKLISPIFHQRNNLAKYSTYLLSAIHDKFIKTNNNLVVPVAPKAVMDGLNNYFEVSSKEDSIENERKVEMIEVYLDELSKTNEVVILDLPISKKNYEGPRISHVVKEMEALAKQKGYTYLKYPEQLSDDAFYDGIHMKGAVADKVSSWLHNSL